MMTWENQSLNIQLQSDRPFLFEKKSIIEIENLIINNSIFVLFLYLKLFNSIYHFPLYLIGSSLNKLIPTISSIENKTIVYLQRDGSPVTSGAIYLKTYHVDQFYFASDYPLLV